MKILITGATGFVGSHLCRRLRELGHDLVILSRDVQKAQKEIPLKADFFSWNPQKESAPSEAFKGVNSVIHLAGEGVADKRWSKSQKQKIYDSRILGTKNLVQTINALQNKPQSFVSTSAIGFYGNRGEEVLNENSSPASENDFLSQVCVDWEKAAQEIDASVALSVIRVGIVLGKNGGALSKMLPPFILGGGGKIGNGQHWMSWIHIKDLVEIYIYCATKNIKNIWNGVAPQPVKNSEFTKTLGNILKRPTIFPVPALALKILFGKMSEILVGSQNVSTQNCLRDGFVFQFDTLRSALIDILSGPHEFRMEQEIPASLEKVFSFFSDAHNLEKITPSHLKFHVLTPGNISMKAGTQIDYKLVLKGIPFRWQSLIEEYKPNRSFVDLQSRGPYEFWKHRHEFETTATGTLIIDKIQYKLPLGQLGNMLSYNYIKKDLKKIFGFRRDVVTEIFKSV